MVLNEYMGLLTNSSTKNLERERERVAFLGVIHIISIGLLTNSSTRNSERESARALLGTIHIIYIGLLTNSSTRKLSKRAQLCALTSML